MQPSPEIAAKLEERYAKLEIAAKVKVAVSPGLWQYLQASENQLIQLMNGTVPPPNAEGSMESSWCLYFLNNDAPTWIVDLLRKLGLPYSRITAADWSKWLTVWEGRGVVAGDGTFLSTAWYATMDLGWTLAFLDYILLDLGYISYTPGGTNPATLTLTGASKLRLAITGDWGTGPYSDGNLPASPSQLIAQQMKYLAPDMNIHLGDVYYAGDSSEETNKLVNCTTPVPFGNFTLNSNHEMYDGAYGYFKTALAAPVFAKQQGTSWFQIRFGEWLIIGLDTAYYDQSTLFMDGALTDPAQVAFLQAAGKTGQKIFLLTHHNPLNETGTAKTGLWNQVVQALGKNPDYWYWGHVHNGIVYSPLSAGGSVKCRCLGNGGIPIGNASWFRNAPAISFYTNKPVANPTIQQQLRVQNGFAIIEFAGGNIKETWYYQDGSQAWKQ